MSELPVRGCYLCGVEIRECMGFALGRDIVALRKGEKPKRIRELCMRCADTVDPAMIV